jgi:hypothetical protein
VSASDPPGSGVTLSEDHVEPLHSDP